MRRSLAAALVAGACLVPVSSAFAATPAPGWTIDSVSYPTNLTPGDSSGHDEYQVTAMNVGAAATNGSAITVTDTLPAGLTPDPTTAPTATDSARNTITCAISGQTVTCTDPDTTAIASLGTITMTVPVDVSGSAPSSITNRVSISGGAAAGASASQPTTVSSTPASFVGQSFDGSVTNADGSPDTQAGSHPYVVSTSFALSSTLSSAGHPIPVANIKDVQVALPPGLIGNPRATPQCTPAQFPNNCPAASQVGTITLQMGTTGSIIVQGPLKVYNLVPPAGVPAQFAFSIAGVPIDLDAHVRTGSDYGLTITAPNLPETMPVLGETLTFFGVPANSNGGGATAQPFLTLPTSCAGPQTTTLSVDSWQSPGGFASTSFVSHDNQGNPTGATGCGALQFSPTLSAQPDTSAADSPSGLAVDVHVPQNDDPAGLATPQLRDATVTLPQGVSVNPASAGGLAACTSGQIGLDSANEPTCPDASKIGSVEIDTPLLSAPLTGGIYLAQQTNNPFGSLLAVYVTAEADGVLVKLAGQVTANPVTGQLTTTFQNNPQVPFSDLKLDFFGGPRAVLATPPSCGTYTATSDLTPWSAPSGADATPSASFAIGSGCVSGFAPAFTAGVADPRAGAFSPFVLSFSRSDTDQDISGFSATLPPGMLAKLAGVQECSEQQLASISSAPGTGSAQAASPSCPAGSQVGTVQTGAGAGPDPFFLSGKAYLTGPYKGAPYGLAVVVPAVAPPLDLGTVVVRQALFIDPETAQVTVVSDPFPTVLQGIPLRIRRVDVTLNRPQFTLNPTSCNPMSVTGTLTSTGGLSHAATSRFQVGGCQNLGFSPKLKISLSGKGKTRSGDHPTLTATLTDPSGQANLHSAKVTLPLSLALDPNNSTHVCPSATAQAVHGGAVGCPTSTIVGSASVQTPLLSQPLSGRVYLVQGVRAGAGGQQVHTLPALLIALRGQIALDLRAQTSVSGGRLVTTFGSIPDAPVSSFALAFTGGPKGILVITGRGRSICGARQVANVSLGAQSGKTNTQKTTLGTPCGKPARLRVLSHQIERGAVILRVRGSERGRLTVTGVRLRRFSRVVSAGIHRVRVALRSHARGAIGAKVTLAPANAAPASRSFTIRR